MNEGWTWLMNARKWHYFRDGKSLCKKWMILSSKELEAGNPDHPDNCKTCSMALKKEFVRQVREGKV